ncbi:MAG: sulfite exporter TauE/SafE family protein [Leptospirales bacterium]|nr:sulfite exporter TauE/SafE family protein [Leptospirales bacterium]
MNNPILFLALGLLAGGMSGLIGIGGGIVLVPVLVFLFGFNQQMAEGTTLAAMVPPIGVLAAYVYYKSGYVNLPAALWISLGFLIGGYLGARSAVSLNPEILRRIFGGFAVLVGFRMLWGS